MHEAETPQKQHTRPQKGRHVLEEAGFAAIPRGEEAGTGSLTSKAAWGSSSIRASEKLRQNLPRKQRLQQGALTQGRRAGDENK